MREPLSNDEQADRAMRAWLIEDQPAIDVDAQVARVLSSLDETPQVRRGFLGRWVDRPRGTGPRSRLRVSATGFVAAIAILVIGAQLIDGRPAPPQAGAPVTRVVAADGSGEYATIADAVAAASDGDSIVIKPGTYAGGVIIEKDLAIAGSGPREEIVISVAEDGPIGSVVVDGGPQSIAFGLWLASPSASVSDLTVEATGDITGILVTTGSPMLERITFVRGQTATKPTYGDGYVAVLLVGDTSPTVRDSTWDGYAAIREGAAPTFDGNTIIGNTLSIDGPGETTVVDNTFLDGGSVSASWGAIVLIEGNRFTDGGIGVDTGSTAIVRDNIIAGIADHTSIYVADAGTQATVVGNTVLDALTAVSVGEGTTAEIRDNELTGSQTGIIVARAGPTIEGNTIEGQGSGILVISGGSPTITGNIIDVAARGISIGADGEPTIAGNEICGGTESVYVAEGANPTIGENTLCEDAPAE